MPSDKGSVSFETLTNDRPHIGAPTTPSNFSPGISALLPQKKAAPERPTVRRRSRSPSNQQLFPDYFVSLQETIELKRQ